MVYQWKMPGVVPVDAQVAGEELQRIYSERGVLEPATVVEESRNESAPLHGCFEWNDEVAAEKYREDQARFIIRTITVKSEPTNTIPTEVRAFVSVQREYKPIEVVVENEDLMSALLKTAAEELTAFKRKYNKIEQLKDVIEAIGRFESKMAS